MPDKTLNLDEERNKQAKYEKMEKCRIEGMTCNTCSGFDISQIECKYYRGDITWNLDTQSP